MRACIVRSDAGGISRGSRVASSSAQHISGRVRKVPHEKEMPGTHRSCVGMAVRTGHLGAEQQAPPYTKHTYTNHYIEVNRHGQR
jgi:hypothetical protein